MRISDWSSDVCSSDLLVGPWNVYGDDKQAVDLETGMRAVMGSGGALTVTDGSGVDEPLPGGIDAAVAAATAADVVVLAIGESTNMSRSEEHTSELQSLMRISYAVFCLKQKNNQIDNHHTTQ